MSKNGSAMFCSRFVVLIGLLGLLGGCAGPKIAVDKLTATPASEKPICACAYDLSVTINPQINNWEGIDKSVQESLDMALANAKLFTAGAATRYRVTADIRVASEPAMSFGDFNGKLEILYTVLDQSGQTLVAKDIYTEAGTDNWTFLGAERHRRARALNIAKNVLEFTTFLRASGFAGGPRS